MDCVFWGLGGESGAPGAIVEGVPVATAKAAQLGAAEHDVGEKLQRAEVVRAAVDQDRAATQQAEFSPHGSTVGIDAGAEAKGPPGGCYTASRNTFMPLREVFSIGEVSRK